MLNLSSDCLQTKSSNWKDLFMDCARLQRPGLRKSSKISLNLEPVNIPIDQCAFMFYTESGEVAGAIGVYVDDFLFVGGGGEVWSKIMASVKSLYSWGNTNTEISFFAVPNIDSNQITQSFLTNESMSRISPRVT